MPFAFGLHLSSFTKHGIDGSGDWGMGRVISPGAEK